MKHRHLKVGVIGGGVAGSSVALYLSELGVDVTLFEKSKSLVNGPPICHLHAGGNLYRDISDAQCITLLKESIELIRLYPEAIDYRPTVIAVPQNDPGEPHQLLSRLKILRDEYAKLIEEDPRNKVLGEVSEYFKFFDKEELKQLQERDVVKHPRSLEEWLIPVAKNVNLESIKFPLLLVQEYGINIFRLAATVSLALQKSETVSVMTQSVVKELSAKSEGWVLRYEKDDVEETFECDYLVNAAGFRSGEIDDMLGFKRERMVEFKAAYVTKCDAFDATWPEVIFHGERGTPNGMAQFTPYPNGYFQLHGMTQNITLFKEGLVRSTTQSSQPKLGTVFLQKIEQGWHEADVEYRTSEAIRHMAQFIPIFNNAKVMSKPLYGAQQIPGEDASLRAADISFEGDRYARCEIVKASSVLNMADEITCKLIELGYMDASLYKKRDFKTVATLKEDEIQRLAQELSQERGYPTSISYRSRSSF